MPRHPSVYARLLRERLTSSGAKVWLVSTGWVGGPYGEGRRMPIAETRAIISAIASGRVDVAGASYGRFQLDVPRSVAGVDPRHLDPRSCWRDPSRYDAQEAELVAKFTANFEQYAAFVSPEVLRLQPR